MRFYNRLQESLRFGETAASHRDLHGLDGGEQYRDWWYVLHNLVTCANDAPGTISEWAYLSCQAN